MAIAPISSVSFRNNYNQVNFEGKKKEKSSGLHVSNSIKAIPLATLIALSPLNTVDADAQVSVNANRYQTEVANSRQINSFNRADVIEYRDFNYNGFDVRINLVKDKQNPATKNIWMEWEHDSGIGGSGYVSRFNHIKYNIIGEDSNSGGNVNFNAIYYMQDGGNSEHLQTFSNPDVCDYVNNLIKNNRTSVLKKNVVLNLSPTIDGWIKNSRHNNSIDWIEQAKNNVQQWGNKVGFWEVNTDDGKYKVFAYSTDNNNENFERIAIEKEGGPTLQVKDLVGGLAKFETIDNIIKEVDLYQINVKKGNAGVHAIYNQQLWEFIASLYQYKRNNNSIEAFDSHYRYNILENGDILASEIR